MTAAVHIPLTRSRASGIDPGNNNVARLLIFHSLACVNSKALITKTRELDHLFFTYKELVASSEKILLIWVI